MGKALAELPIEPVIGRLVLLGAVLGALDPVLTIAAAMGYRDPFVNPPTKRQQADEVTTPHNSQFSDIQNFRLRLKTFTHSSCLRDF